MNSHSTIEFITVIDEIYLFILNFISIKITYSTILNKLNEQRFVCSFESSTNILVSLE